MKQVVSEIRVKDCARALEVYRAVFGGDVRNVTRSEHGSGYGGEPGQIVHSELHVNSRCVFYFADIIDPRRAHPGNVTLMLHLESGEEIQRVYNVLCRRGAIRMPLQATHLGGWHAILTDQFGTPWSLHCAK